MPRIVFGQNLNAFFSLQKGSCFKFESSDKTVLPDLDLLELSWPVQRHFNHRQYWSGNPTLPITVRRIWYKWLLWRISLRVSLCLSIAFFDFCHTIQTMFYFVWHFFLSYLFGPLPLGRHNVFLLCKRNQLRLTIQNLDNDISIRNSR